MAGSEKKRPRVDLALVHYPVLNRNGETIGSAVTNLDLHDIARAAKTFGVDTFYVVTPYADQQRLCRELLDHWLAGAGGRADTDRAEALALVRLCSDLDELYEQVTGKWQERPLVVSTGARPGDLTWSYARMRERLASGASLLILFGTAWGLHPEVLDGVDASLPPVRGDNQYNHLSVRSAAAIVLDRLLGRDADSEQ
ncbi:MAG: RNA methyltransferase [Desulfobacterales bacterium]|nr:RNA methyltransferase [Desulfobacterales bacterium]